ncbi:MAG: CPBP family glutamic-type intramembrane protease [Janthinobacterium lividum]
MQLAAGSGALCLPYFVVATAFGYVSPLWAAVYLLAPPASVLLLTQARLQDPEQRGTWQDFAVLLSLGTAVDLRWMEPAWPSHLAVFNKVLLLDLGIIAFIGARHFKGVGFDLRLRVRDAAVGLREFVFYAPAAIAIGIALGFLHWHHGWPRPTAVVTAAGFTFFFIAVPEELFFRGWLQNLLEPRLGRHRALLITAVLFGLAHFNKRAVHFNWRYVLLAALAGLFYGRAWRQDRRVAASAITHTLVDTVWSLCLR